MKKICTIILSVAILCNLCSCGLRCFFHDTNKKTFASWQPELSLPLAIYTGKIKLPNEDVALYSSDAYRALGSNHPLCLKGDTLYIYTETWIGEEMYNSKWSLYSFHIRNHDIREIVSYKYNSKTSFPIQTAYYEGGNIYVYDSLRTIVYNIASDEIKEGPAEYYFEFYLEPYDLRGTNSKLSLTLNGETRELTMEGLLSEHPLMQTAEKIVEKSLHKPVFCGAFFIDRNIYFSCAIYNEHGFASGLLFYYDWAEDRCYFLDYTYLPLGETPKHTNYFPVPII